MRQSHSLRTASGASPSSPSTSPRPLKAPPATRGLPRPAARWMLRLTPVVALLSTALPEPGQVHRGQAHAGGKAVSPAKAEARVDKWQFHLFNSTPREFMREMSTDRPDATESAITVDAGHFQIESSLFDYGRTRQGGIEEEIFTHGAVNFKIGLFNNVDIQVVFDSYTEVRSKDRATKITETVEGYSDLQVRLKINLWGNDGGNTAVAFFPFIKIPTGSDLSNDNVEGGLILPFSVGLTEKIGLGLMLEVDFVYDEEERGYKAEIFHTAVLGFDLTDKLGLFVEYSGTTGSAEFDYVATANAGFTYAVTDDLQLDTGVRVGLNDTAEDFGVFAGFSVRF